MIDKDRPSTWVPYRESLCRGCNADCCSMLLEVTTEDLIRLGLTTEDEAEISQKKLFKRLRKEKVVMSYRDGTGLFMMQSKANGDCQFLDSATRLCTVYDKRPGVCRKFPSIGPRPGSCPARRKLHSDQR
jgi:Fe-S-cluster containining protein